MLRNHRIICLAFTTWACSAKAENRTVVVSTPDWPPFYLPADQHANMGRGFAWEVSQLCVERIHATPVWQQFPIRRMFKEMTKGKLDLNIMSFKADRTTTVDYGKEVVFTNTYGLWMRKNLNPVPKSIQDLNHLKIADLVGLRPSDPYRTYLDQRISKPDGDGVFVVPTTVAVAKMVASGHADVAAMSNAEMKFRIKTLNLTDKVSNTGMILKRQDYFFVLAKSSELYRREPKILQHLDQCVRVLRLDGTLTKLQDKYDL